MKLYCEKEINTLSEKQKIFTLMIGELILFAYREGYMLSFGDAFRDHRIYGVPGIKHELHRKVEGQLLPVRNYSHKNSTHKFRLAVDFNLFKDGEYLTRSEDYRELGEYWESMGGTWGGRFNDGNHFSIEHNGVK